MVKNKIKMKQTHIPLSKEQYNSIKPGDVIERMLAFAVPVYLNVQNVNDKLIDCGWTFDRNTGLEIDEDLSVTASYISKILTEDQKNWLKKNKDLSNYKI